MQKMSSKASPRPLFNFGKYSKAATACQKQDISKDDHHKVLKKLTLYYLLNLISFYGSDYEKPKGASDQSFFRLQSQFRKIPIVVMS